ncbi:MAG: hypothetical protein PHE21_01510 [Candidatus Dojkabacteria bacterium]|nr:hypothetical protein [Candidatus Dojkabacteria bacterium]
MREYITIGEVSENEPHETVLQPITNMLLELGFIIKSIQSPLSLIGINTV